SASGKMSAECTLSRSRKELVNSRPLRLNRERTSSPRVTEAAPYQRGQSPLAPPLSLALARRRLRTLGHEARTLGRHDELHRAVVERLHPRPVGDRYKGSAGQLLV